MRFLAILYVKVFVIKNLLAFSLTVCEGMREFYELACVPDFPKSLHPKQVKTIVTEIYAATVLKLKQSLGMATKGAGGPIMHANFDLWTSRTSSEKYLGEFVFMTWLEEERRW